VRNGHLGDLYCRISVETPVNLSARQKELLEEFEKSLVDGGSKHSPRQSSWVDKVKGIFH
jgi:molecular chaperone DnaJ